MTALAATGRATDSAGRYGAPSGLALRLLATGRYRVAPRTYVLPDVRELPDRRQADAQADAIRKRMSV